MRKWFRSALAVLLAGVMIFLQESEYWPGIRIAVLYMIPYTMLMRRRNIRVQLLLRMTDR